jgi:biopolymer transport protein ExbB/TolQ
MKAVYWLVIFIGLPLLLTWATVTSLNRMALHQLRSVQNSPPIIGEKVVAEEFALLLADRVRDQISGTSVYRGLALAIVDELQSAQPPLFRPEEGGENEKGKGEEAATIEQIVEKWIEAMSASDSTAAQNAWTELPGMVASTANDAATASARDSALYGPAHKDPPSALAAYFVHTLYKGQRVDRPVETRFSVLDSKDVASGVIDRAVRLGLGFPMTAAGLEQEQQSARAFTTADHRALEGIKRLIVAVRIRFPQAIEGANDSKPDMDLVNDWSRAIEHAFAADLYTKRRDAANAARTAIDEAAARYAERVLGRTQILGYPAHRFLQVVNGPIQSATLFAFWYSMLVVVRAGFRIPSARLVVQPRNRFMFFLFRPLISSAERGAADEGDLLKLHHLNVDNDSNALYVLDWHRLLESGRSFFLEYEAAHRHRRLGIHIHEAYIRVVNSALRSRSLRDVKQELDDQRDSVIESTDSDLELVRYGVWLLPSIGFIGTILGIGAALMNSRGMVTAPVEKLDEATAAVTNELGVAFDTTLVALLLSIALYLSQILVTVWANRVADAMRHRIDHDFVSRLNFDIYEGKTPTA